jgi:5'-nucleotidase/UDP-sugar diphosphatase
MINKLTRNRLILSVITLAIFLSFIFYANGETKPIHLVILYSNDTHGNLIVYDKINQIGGIAKTATLIKQIKDENKDNTLVLHAGDELSRGDELTASFGGEVNMRAMEMMGYDAFTPGNGDFYFGIQNLIKQTSLVKFPILQANVVYKDTNKRIFQPYVIKEISGIKIGILGLGVIREKHPLSQNLKLLDPINVAKEIIPELQEKSDIIIALTHIGIGADVLLEEKVPQIDIIVGGHTHIKLGKPMMVPRKNGSGEVIIVQAGKYTQFLGKLDIYLEKTTADHYKIVKSEGRLIPIDKNVKEDEIIATFLKQYSEKLSQIRYTPKTDIVSSGTSDSPMGKFLAEAIKIKTNSDVSLLDLGSAQSGAKVVSNLETPNF